MSDKMVLCLIIIAQFACFAALMEIFTRWAEEIVHRGIEKRKEQSFTIAPRGTGEANAKRGWK